TLPSSNLARAAVEAVRPPGGAQARAGEGQGLDAGEAGGAGPAVLFAAGVGVGVHLGGATVGGDLDAPDIAGLGALRLRQKAARLGPGLGQGGLAVGYDAALRRAR